MPEQQANTCPIVMCFSGHDPCGGAGIQADIEAISANGAHAATIITALTVQDSRNVQQVIPSDTDALIDAAATVLDDMPVAVFKIGLLGNVAVASAVARVITQHPTIPVVLDPVLAAGGGTPLANTELLTAIREQLLPLTTLITPNTIEATRLTGSKDIDTCARQLINAGCKHVLVTGTHADTKNVVNTLYGPGMRTEFSVDRLEGEYHGSGCTLASASAAQLAQGLAIPAAVKAAIDYTWMALQHGRPLGKGQTLPNRLFQFTPNNH